MELLRPTPGTPPKFVGGVADGSAGARERSGPLLPISVRAGGRKLMPSAAGNKQAARGATVS